MRQNQLPQKGETLSLACVAAGCVTTSASFHRYCLIILKLAPPKHSFSLIPLAMQAILPSIYHLHLELRFLGRVRLLLALLSLRKKVGVIPLFVVPIHFEYTRSRQLITVGSGANITRIELQECHFFFCYPLGNQLSHFVIWFFKT